MHGAGCRLKHGWLAGRSRGPGCLVRQCPHAAQAKACGLGRALGVGRSGVCRRRLLPISAGWQPYVGPGERGARCPGVRAGPYEFALKTRSCVIWGGKLPYSPTKTTNRCGLPMQVHLPPFSLKKKKKRLCVLHNIPHYILFIFMSPRGAAGGLIPSREGPGASPGVFRFSGGSTAPRPCFFFYTHV